MSPHEVRNGSVAVNTEREVHWVQRLLEVTVHYEVRVREPNLSVMVQSVEVVVPRLVSVLQSRIEPLLL